MAKKIIHLDLDNTLLNSDKIITPRTYEALEHWASKGNLIAINSGRPMTSVEDTIRELSLDKFETYAVAFNGAWIRDTSGKEILKKAISLDDVQTIASIAKEMGIHAQTYDLTHILTSALDDELCRYTHTVHLPFRVLENFPEGITEAPCKVLCIKVFDDYAVQAHERRLELFPETIDKEKEFVAPSGETVLAELAELGKRIEKACEGRVSCLKSTPCYLESFPSDAGKGLAITELSELLNIPIENTFAAGDAQNDISMLEAAGTGIAMLNAEDAVKEAADVITAADNDHDGLADLLFKYA